jgi:hypothetical protein
MALVLADRVKETTTTTGTGTVTLLGAAAGFQSFAAVGNGNTTYYTIAGQTTSEWEVGIGTYTSAGTTLSRTTVLASSNSGSLVTFSAGTKDVFVTYPAGRSVYADGTTLTATNSSVLPIASGGTNSTATPTNGGIGYGTGTAHAYSTAGTSGQVLTSAGAAVPTWTTATNANTASAIVQRDASGNFSAGTITASLTGTASTATNIAGGANGSVPYQSGAGATAFLSGNTSTTPQFVTSTGTGAAAQAPTLTSSTGTGSVVLATSPTLVTPNLGTPSTLVGTNITGTAASLSIGGNAATAGGFTPSQTNGVASRIVVADASGYINNNYFNSTDDVSAGTLTYVMAKFGDNYYRSATAAKVATFISGQTMNIAGSSSTVTGNATGTTFGFNSGYGSVATAYGCRAWVSFAGATGTRTGSGNVSSVTRTSTGNYTVNFASALVDAAYAPVCTTRNGSIAGLSQGTLTTSSFTFLTTNVGGSSTDSTDNGVAVFR